MTFREAFEAFLEMKGYRTVAAIAGICTAIYFAALTASVLM